jgi:hypothetical protein
VGGAAVGNELADELGVGDGVALVLGVVTLAVPLDKAVDVAEMLDPGENLVGVGEGEDDVQAEIAAEASMVKVPQPMAVNLALSPVPAVVVRTFMKPPHASGRWRPRFPGPRHQKPTPEGKRAADPVAARACRRQVPESAEGHKRKAHGRHRHAMACSPLEY